MSLTSCEIVRLKLGTPSPQVERKTLPTARKILAEITSDRVGGEEFDRTAPKRLKATIY